MPNAPKPPQLVAALIALGVSRARSYGQIAKHYGQLPAEQAILAELAAGHEVTNASLASRLGMSTGGVSPAVDRLERQGLVVRRPHPEDRRSRLVELTPEGQRMMRAGRHILEREVAAVARGLSAEQLRLVLDVLAAAAGAYETAADELTSPEGEVPEWKLD